MTYYILTYSCHNLRKINVHFQISVQSNDTLKKSGKKKKKKSIASANPEPVPTSGFHDLEDVETWVCAICKCYDPVISSPIKGSQQELATTEWIGCDCNRWYHQYCTKLKNIDDSFSCKQLNRKCLPMWNMKRKKFVIFNVAKKVFYVELRKTEFIRKWVMGYTVEENTPSMSKQQNKSWNVSQWENVMYPQSL